jgi:hypothetical protein
VSRLPSKGPGRGGPARGYSWEPFQDGNTVAVRHGAYVGPWRLEGEVADLALRIAEHVPGMNVAFMPAVNLLSTTLLRIERATAALDEVDDHAASPLHPYVTSESGPRLDRLREDCRRWIALAVKLMAELGLTPASAAALGADVVSIERYRQEQLVRLQEAGRVAFEARDARDAEEGS